MSPLDWARANARLAAAIAAREEETERERLRLESLPWVQDVRRGLALVAACRHDGFREIVEIRESYGGWVEKCRLCGAITKQGHALDPFPPGIPVR